ncbi:unnamed protein product [Caenorhabditis brenneri]
MNRTSIIQRLDLCLESELPRWNELDLQTLNQQLKDMGKFSLCHRFGSVSSNLLVGVIQLSETRTEDYRFGPPSSELPKHHNRDEQIRFHPLGKSAL